MTIEFALGLWSAVSMLAVISAVYLGYALIPPDILHLPRRKAAPVIRRTLLVTASQERRVSWLAQLRQDGAQVMQCSGPGPLCPLLSGDRRCPLHEEADAAVYDQDVVSRDFLLALLAAPRRIPIHFAIANTGHAPHITYALAGGVVRRVEQA